MGLAQVFLYIWVYKIRMKKALIYMFLLASTALTGYLFVGATQPSTPTAEYKQLDHVSPSVLGIDSLRLYQGIDAIIQEAMDSMAFPGCQVLLARSGQVFFEKSYGYHTYAKKSAVLNSDIYDLASITKVVGATLALMKLYEEGKLDPDATLGFYFPYLAKTDKANLTLREILAHQAGLKPWIPYYKTAQKKNGRYKKKTVSFDSSYRYPFRLSDSALFLYKDYEKKKIYKMIKKSELSEEKKYVYSGLFFYLIPDLVERLSGMPLEQYLDQTYYQPMHASTLCFTPLKKFKREAIVPTEVDDYFRMDTLHGIVHDEGAAMMLGVSGNAGLFSNSMDLAKVFQMLLNDGSFGGVKYLQPATIKEFTKVQYPKNDNRRGMGFDKPLLEYDEQKSSVAKNASPNSYGHSGYTGTLVWADPDAALLFVFLSNRVHPTRNNATIYKLNIRPRIHNLVYDLLPSKDSLVQELN